MKYLLIISLYFVANGAYTQSVIEGQWNVGKDNTIIEISKSGDIWEGKTVSSDNRKMKEGALIIKNLARKKDVWLGKFYLFRIKKWADISLVPEQDVLEATVTYGSKSGTLKWHRHISDLVKE